MERYNGSEHRTTETYMIQGANSHQNLTATPPLEEISVMDSEVAPEFIVDQGPYFPAAAANYYGYYCTGFESPGEWDDHHRFFGLDGPDLHYPGLQTEGLPYVYYTPSYGYAQSPYNPYNPYIPGAVVGVDGSFVGAQQYYTGPGYQHPVSSPAYFPIVVQPRPDIVTNTSLDPTLVNLGMSSASRNEGAGLKHVLPTSMGLVMPPRTTSGEVRTEPSQAASHQIHPPIKTSEGSQASLSKQPSFHGTNSSSSVPNSTSNLTQGRSASGLVHVADPSSLGRVSAARNPSKLTVPTNTGGTDYGSNAHGWASIDKLRPRMQFSGVLNNGNGNPDVLGEQNRGPRTNRLKSPWTSSISVKAYTTKAGASNAQGNIVIYADQYNREDFPVNYPNAKFFVIKSYSEDDVHKSIKYNVWSSTPSGNKRLDSAYEDAQRISGGRPGHCPVFLFFSVNASGLFCGVAEMIGPVDFQKDMDFWQQDKWNGSFPVKWHIIKDVPNTNFRHIILENNENKPVTNSRDTQEIRYLQGMEMLNIFKSHSSKTSILDDFVYYEERQKHMQAEKSRLLGKTYDNSFFIPTFVPSTTPSVTINQPPKTDKKSTEPSNWNNSGKTATSDEKVVLGKAAPGNEKVLLGKMAPSNEKVVSRKTSNDERVASGMTAPSDEKIVSGKTAPSVEKVVSGKMAPSAEKVVLGKTAPNAEKVVSKLDPVNPSSNAKDARHERVGDVNDVLRIGSLSIDSEDTKKEGNTNYLGSMTGDTTVPVDVVTVGSMPVKVNGFGESSSGVLTVGSIPIDPKATKLNKQAVVANNVR